MYNIKISRGSPKMKLRGNLRGGNSLKAKGDYQGRVHSDQMVIVIVRRGG